VEVKKEEYFHKRSKRGIIIIMAMYYSACIAHT